MKIKADFVTNSSSSSFIVAFPKKIRANGVQYVASFIASKYAETVHTDAMKQKPLRASSPKIRKIIAQEITHGYIDDSRFPDSWDQDREFAEREGVTKQQISHDSFWGQLFWDERNLKQNAFANILAGEFLEEVPDDYYIYTFNYGDEDGEYFSEMEHNNIFRNLEHLRINKH